MKIISGIIITCEQGNKKNMTDWYEVLERFSIIAESEGDEKALQMIRKQYGAKWVEWLSKYLWGRKEK